MSNEVGWATGPVRETTPARMKAAVDLLLGQRPENEGVTRVVIDFEHGGVDVHHRTKGFLVHDASAALYAAIGQHWPGTPTVWIESVTIAEDRFTAKSRGELEAELTVAKAALEAYDLLRAERLKERVNIWESES